MIVKKDMSSQYGDHCDDDVEELTEEEVESIFVELVVNMFYKEMKKFDKLLLMIIHHPLLVTLHQELHETPLQW